MYAAELYARGVSKRLWLSRPEPVPSEEKVRELGIAFPREEDVNLEILAKKGVPAAAISFYGKGALSTYHEALLLKAALPEPPRRLLIVTSQFHCRRARMIFRKAFPESEVLCSASPYEPPSQRWWKDKFVSQLVVLEVVKFFYWIVGGGFVRVAD